MADGDLEGPSSRAHLVAWYLEVAGDLARSLESEDSAEASMALQALGHAGDRVRRLRSAEGPKET